MNMMIRNHFSSCLSCPSCLNCLAGFIRTEINLGVIVSQNEISRRARVIQLEMEPLGRKVDGLIRPDSFLGRESLLRAGNGSLERGLKAAFDPYL